jgi:hypothetical protein
VALASVRRLTKIKGRPESAQLHHQGLSSSRIIVLWLRLDQPWRHCGLRIFEGKHKRSPFPRIMIRGSKRSVDAKRASSQAPLFMTTNRIRTVIAL